MLQCYVTRTLHIQYLTQIIKQQNPIFKHSISIDIFDKSEQHCSSVIFEKIHVNSVSSHHAKKSKAFEF